VYNGEIYNYKEIQHTYLPKHTFNTHSDSEVILELFAEKGLKAVEPLNGMFAIALYDKTSQELHLIRDRMGIKPIYYYWNGKDFAYASELKSLLSLKLIKSSLKINKDAIPTFLHLGYIPAPASIYEHIYKLPPGHRLTVNKQGVQIKCYWKVEDKIKSEPITNEQIAKNELHEALQKAVHQQLVSDVPFGSFLSGGIDSSLVTAIAQSKINTPLNTFSIGFKEAKHNEAHHAKAIAKSLGTHHHEFFVSYKDAERLVEDLTDIYAEPYADSSAIPTLMVAELSRKQVKMVLSGDGGDELFQGYGAYNWALRLNKPLMGTLRHPMMWGLSKMGNRYKRAALVMDYGQKAELRSHIFSQEQYLFSEHELKTLLAAGYNINFDQINRNFKTKRKLNPAETQSLFDLHYYLPDDLLVKVDRASMHHSLEVRVPLLDHDVVELALNIDYSLKVKNKCSKYLLKEILYDYVPKALFNRPKQGFSIPLAHWLKTDLKYLIDEYLSNTMIKEHGFFDLESINNLKNRFFAGEGYLYNRLWACICLQMWAVKTTRLLAKSQN
jgi:asparagine synthase (glutamine-hydrolysing)